MELTATQEMHQRNMATDAEQMRVWAGAPDRMVAYFDFPAERPGGPTTRGAVDWWRRAFVPARDGATVMSWMAAPMGVITKANVYTNNCGARLVSLTVRATNGATYYGRASWDGGTCIRLRKAKTQ